MGRSFPEVIDASIQEALERIHRDLADAVTVGLGTATAARFQTIATELRALGLEAPAEGADRLAACVSPEADQVDGLNAFARLVQMVDAGWMGKKAGRGFYRYAGPGGERVAD